MNTSNFNTATHFSIVWGVMLAIVTLLEWNSLDRDPMRKEILSPFIQRDISVTAPQAERFKATASSDGSQAAPKPDAGLQYEVEFKFDGPRFLAYFFLPVLVFHGVGRIIAMVRRRAGSSGD